MYVCGMCITHVLYMLLCACTQVHVHMYNILQLGYLSECVYA